MTLQDWIVGGVLMMLSGLVVVTTALISQFRKK